MERIVFVIGVSGCGKSTIGKLLSEKLGTPFFDGDDFHPESNITKMKSGQPLTDKDRSGWLKTLNDLVKEEASKKGAVIACSALKESYRRILSDDINNVDWIYLNGSKEIIAERIQARTGHFMPGKLLDSQFDTLEIPEYGIHVEIKNSPENILTEILHDLEHMKEFGIVGLGVMGKGLARNLARQGFKLSLYNRHVKGLEENVSSKFITEFQELNQCSGYDNVKQFVESLITPRKILIMVQAGEVVDQVINELLNYIEKGDILIDAGNSHYSDTNKRMTSLTNKGINFIGLGVSGGEEGALNGPSLMPGGSRKAYSLIEKFLLSIAAKGINNDPCCNYIGTEGAGHFVKMVHNGIEYAEMQLIAECYSILRFGQGLEPVEISNIFNTWNNSELESYLLASTTTILKKRKGDDYLIDLIHDKASHKGTGKWTTITAAELGIPFTMSSAALNARYVSALKDMRVRVSKNLKLKREMHSLDIDAIKNGYMIARVINHCQGFQLIEKASIDYDWEIDLSAVAKVWSGGCIIASALMNELSTLLSEETSLFESQSIQKQLSTNYEDLKNSVSRVLQMGFPIPCFSESLNYLNAIAQENGIGNIIQAQRDLFGAHTYRLKKDPEGESHHTNWEN